MKYVNGAQIILRQMMEARARHDLYAINPSEVVAGELLNNLIGIQVHRSINRRSRQRTLSNHALNNAFNRMFLREEGEGLADWMIRRLGECMAYDDLGSQQRTKVFRRILRKQFKSHWTNMRLDLKFSGSVLDLAREDRRRSVWRLRDGYQSSKGTLFPSGWPLKLSLMGDFIVTLGDKVYGTMLQSQVRKSK